ncbi:hypothetical protein BH24ACI5_BH24ACI5_11360 [soil metagenome]
MIKTVSVGAVAIALAAALTSSILAAPQQESKSGPLAKQLVQLLDASKIDSIAAADPSGGFVAALYIPGTQLLVVSGRFQTPDFGNYRLERKEYRELYMDLMGSALPGSRMVASDVHCDGFTSKPQRDDPADTWERDNKTQAFEGSRKAKLSDDVYEKVYADADAEYARILELLLAQAKPKGSHGSSIARATTQPNGSGLPAVARVR